MRRKLFFLLLALWAAGGVFAQSKKVNPNKDAVMKSVEKHQQELIKLSDEVWAYAETALKEEKSSKALADYAEAQGFQVKRGVAGMPTAFTAEFGSGKPVIGIMGEFDALPGISQKAQPEKEPLMKGAPGHGCGHNLFGAGSLGAAVAIKEQIQQGKLKGTVRFYGTPAEESVGGKIYMAREGLFSDVDICLDWHPDVEIAANMQSSQAMVDFIIEFKGKAAHAAGDPWNGRSAVDGLELFLDGVNMMREHVKPSVRMHYVIKAGGDVPNVVPEYAKAWMWIRDSKREGVEDVFARVREAAKGAGLMAGVESKITVIGGDYELLVNKKGAEALQKNMETLGPIKYTEEEIAFAKKIQEVSTGKQTGLDGAIHPLKETKENPDGGSTDVGDISWIVPEITALVTTAPANAPWHSWAVVACGGMSIGHKGMVFAAKSLAMTMVDLFENETLRKDMRTEFETRRNGHIYKAYIPEGPPPIPAKE
ncbi:aminobenzoyl-glutamate utilization protein B [Chryseolinea serpens]|uniref:Aminobenzoyl-glutamate utilization protein B n=1 Tax=Chryseolinea serpens TaxID=947013 RepID=A0A1M5XGL2_9BACT|nr:amidohydrolase [Chryseolinea serpens]SHH98644.1 aminobenzoyl-glutamate utilization protein B [Chryseolinea serpens]